MDCSMNRYYTNLCHSMEASSPFCPFVPSTPFTPLRCSQVGGRSPRSPSFSGRACAAGNSTGTIPVGGGGENNVEVVCEMNQEEKNFKMRNNQAWPSRLSTQLGSTNKASGGAFSWSTGAAHVGDVDDGGGRHLITEGVVRTLLPPPTSSCATTPTPPIGVDSLTVQDAINFLESMLYARPDVGIRILLQERPENIRVIYDARRSRRRTVSRKRRVGRPLTYGTLHDALEICVRRLTNDVTELRREDPRGPSLVVYPLYPEWKDKVVDILYKGDTRLKRKRKKSIEQEEEEPEEKKRNHQEEIIMRDLSAAAVPSVRKKRGAMILVLVVDLPCPKKAS